MALVTLDFAESAVVAVVPPVSVESAGALPSLALVLSAVGSIIEVLPLVINFFLKLSLS